MSSDKSLKSPHSDETSSSAKSMSSKVEHQEAPVTEKVVGLSEFLDFLNVSCHVNDVITSGGQQKELTAKGGAVSKPQKQVATVDFEQLAENRLVNALFSQPTQQRRSSRQDDDNVTDSTGSTTERSRRRSSTLTSARHATKKPESPKIRGLHPKLSEKLNYVIDEGILDSVLHFICPVPVPPSLTARSKGKQKDATAEVSIPAADSAVVGDTEADNASMLGNADASSSNMVKLKDMGRQVRRKSLLKTKLLNAAVVEKKEPEVIIHVCDEVKNTSRDFSCPQSLLVTKMGYFADVTAGQKLEDMDISVHCDVQIFDWLMRWVKYNASASTSITSVDAGPQLDACNVVPILVSASFLQMEPLLVDCLSYCHAKLNDVVRASTNLSCLNDSIVTRLAAMFTNLELEMVRDKKERVTPRLWTKLIQSLCEVEPEALRGHYFSLSGLFRCSKCGKCLTNTMKSYISCIPSNLRLNRWGQLVSHHVRDTAWDINGYILQLFRELKSWRRVYWRMWGHCHFLYCCICEMHFAIYQINWCRFHPEAPNFLGPVTEGRMAGPAGRYPCCGQQAFRYETLPGPNGCQFREHSVLLDTDRERAIMQIAQIAIEGYALYENPPAGKAHDVNASGDTEPHWTGLSLKPARSRQGLLPVLNPEESSDKIERRTRHCASFFAESSTETDTDSADTLENNVQPGRKFLSNHNDFSSSSDGCESDCSGAKGPYNKKGRKKRQTDIPGRYWAGELSSRSNQDHQREFEEKVMKQVIAIVNKKTGSDYNLAQNALPSGGSYVRLEADWKEYLKQRGNNNNNNNNSNNINCNLSTTLSKNTKRNV